MIIFLPIMFVIRQPDLGTSLIILLCGLITIFLGGVRKTHILYLISSLIIIIPLMWKFLLLPYQKLRILTMLDPSRDPLGSGYTLFNQKLQLARAVFWKRIFKWNAITIRISSRTRNRFHICSFF